MEKLKELKENNPEEAFRILTEYLSINPLFQEYTCILERRDQREASLFQKLSEKDRIEVLKKQVRIKNLTARERLLAYRTLVDSLSDEEEKGKYSLTLVHMSTAPEDYARYGEFLFEGKRYMEALPYLTRGLPHSVGELAECYRCGLGVAKSIDRLERLLSTECRKGNQAAFDYLVRNSHNHKWKDPYLREVLSTKTISLYGGLQRTLVQDAIRKGYITALDIHSILPKQGSIPLERTREFLESLGILVLDEAPVTQENELEVLWYCYQYFEREGIDPLSIDYLRKYNINKEELFFYKKGITWFTHVLENTPIEITSGEAALYFDIPLDVAAAKRERVIMYLENEADKLETAYLYLLLTDHTIKDRKKRLQDWLENQGVML